jgi:hypothetical protein
MHPLRAVPCGVYVIIIVMEAGLRMSDFKLLVFCQGISRNQ